MVNKENGFTLIELIVAISILGLMGALASPYISRSIDQIKVKNAAFDIFNALKLVRHEAILSHSEKTFSLDIDEPKYQIQSRSTSNTVKKLDVPNAATFSLFTAESELINEGSGSIRFFQDGSSTGGRISLVYRQKTYEISVSWLTGQIDLQ